MSGPVGADGLERGPGPAPWPVQHPMNTAPHNAAPPSTLPTHPASVAVAPPARMPSRPVTGAPASAPPASVPPALYVPAPERYPALDPAEPSEPERSAENRKKRPKPRRVKSRPPKDRKDRQAVHELELREIAGHLTFTRNDVTAWYHLPDIQWAFRADKERTSILLGIAAQYAALGGYRLHLRRTNRPYPAVGWARRMAALTPNPVPDVRGAPSWSDHLEAGQRRLHATSLAEGEVYLGVVFQRRTMREQAIETLNALRKRGSGNAERNRLEQLVGRFDEVLGAFGMQARPATAKQVEWLIHRSVALCMPPPPALSPAESGGWETGDLLAFTEHTMRYRSPYGSTVKLLSRIGDEYVERHVAVLTFGRMEELSIPERHEPWLHFHEQLPWPMEISSRVDVLGQGDALRSLEHKLLTIRSQQRDYHEHEMDAPPELERLAQRALDISDEMSTGLDLDAARVHGWHRIAVAGRSEEECMRRARALTDHYRSMRITLNHPRDQLRLLDEFIPGQPVANTGYLRRMPAKYFAAAIPQAAAAIGDRRGPIIGETCGTSHRPVMWDPHYATEVRERSGLAVFVAEPGGGKSTLMGGIAYLAARRGVQCTILDPSGPLARLATMPELAPFSKVYNLTRGEPGTLAPYGLIPTPRREHFAAGPAGDAEWTSAVAAARAERKALATDICMMLLPPQIQRERSSPILLQRAARQVEPEEWATLDELISVVAGFGDEGSELAETLGDVRDMPLSRLFFGRSTAAYGQDEAVLTVITMAGLALPDLTIDREFWQLEERMALPMLHLATAFTTRRAYGRAMHERKLVALDETHFLAGWGSGRALFTRLARDSRKWNIAALAASQNPVDILGLDVQNLVSTVFVGRIAEDPEIAAQALRMLGVQRGIGYENTLAQLSLADSSNDQRLGYREFVMRDVDGRVQKFRADLAYVAGLLEHLDTTADPLGDVGRIAGQEGDAR
nr:ATP-binding protein [Cryptosporangium phraense]